MSTSVIRIFAARGLRCCRDGWRWAARSSLPIIRSSPPRVPPAWVAVVRGRDHDRRLLDRRRAADRLDQAEPGHHRELELGDHDVEPQRSERSTAMTASRPLNTAARVRDTTDRRGPYHRCQHEPPGGSTGQDPDRERRREWLRDAPSAATSSSRVLGSPEFADVLRLRSEIVMRPEARQSITRADVRGLDLPEHPRQRPCSGSSPARRIALDAAGAPERRSRRCLVPVGSRWLVTTASSGPRSPAVDRHDGEPPAEHGRSWS